MSNVAMRLLTTDAPSETKQDLAASAQLMVSTGTALHCSPSCPALLVSASLLPAMADPTS